MVNYYKHKREVYFKLKKTIEKAEHPIPFEHLKIAVFEEYGFSGKMVRNTLILLEEAAYIKHIEEGDKYASV